MNTNADDARPWCEERLHNPAEDLYYARLFSARETRAAITAIAAIYIELETTTTAFRDLNTARTKLAWWREELARLADGRPAHPATQLLATSNAMSTLNLLPDLVTGAELNLLAGPANDLASAGMQAERGFARLVIALGTLTNAKGTDDYAALGKALGLARTLTTTLAPEARSAIATTARNGLVAERTRIVASPPMLHILAALAWHRATRPETTVPTRTTNRRRVFIAWRAARGKLPRPLRTKRR
ncbi:MAG: squalene/phytoene synthase family protein [Gammaproteobacteria bacterium]